MENKAHNEKKSPDRVIVRLEVANNVRDYLKVVSDDCLLSTLGMLEAIRNNGLGSRLVFVSDAHEMCCLADDFGDFVLFTAISKNQDSVTAVVDKTLELKRDRVHGEMFEQMGRIGEFKTTHEIVRDRVKAKCGFDIGELAIDIV